MDQILQNSLNIKISSAFISYMVSVKLNGGLGNQMFQYAAARYVAQQKNQKLIIDSTFLKYYPIHQSNTRRDYELNHFNVSAQVLDHKNKYVLLLLSNKLVFKLVEIIKKLYKNIIIINENNFFASKALEKNYILEGYFQNEVYFKDIAATIHDEFSLKNDLDPQNAKLAQIMVNENSVSLHVRRGDYTNVNNSTVYHICTKEYFLSAIDYVIQRIQNPTFYIFSDDMDWVKANIILDYPFTYITHNTGASSYIDLVLMSKCKHNIISNSTFSWWGAWLNRNNSKVVVAPKFWFKNSKENDDFTLPSDWARL